MSNKSRPFRLIVAFMIAGSVLAVGLALYNGMSSYGQHVSGDDYSHLYYVDGEVSSIDRDDNVLILNIERDRSDFFEEDAVTFIFEDSYWLDGVIVGDSITVGFFRQSPPDGTYVAYLIE